MTKGSFFYDNDIQCVLCSEPLFFGELEPTVNIFVILIGLVLIFKNEISSIVSAAFNAIKLNSEAIVK